MNVVALRWGDFKSIFKGRSSCPSCQKKLSYFELLPILSFLIQAGKCRNCRKSISLRYPIVEILTALVLYLLYEAQVGWISFVFSGIIFSILIIISLYDLKNLVIPDGLVWSFNVLAFLGTWLLFRPYIAISPASQIQFQEPILPFILAGLGLFSFFAILWFVSRGKWMGFGDAKLALGIGLLLGSQKGLLALVLSFWIGTLFALLLMLFQKGKYSMKSQIPFGPFLALGAFISFIYGDKIMAWYLGI